MSGPRAELKATASEFSPVQRNPNVAPAGRIGSFGDKETELFFIGESAGGGVGKSARRRLPPQVWSAAQRTLDLMNASSLEDQLPTGSESLRMR